MRTNDPFIVVAGVLVALAVIGLTGFLVARLSRTSDPVVIASVLTAFAAVLAAVPPIIKALRGR